MRADADTAALRPALIVIGAGVAAALHVGKLPPAVAALQHALGVSLVQAGFLLSLVQFAGMAAGVAFGALADSIGLARSMRIGLWLLAAASAAGGVASDAASLMLLRAVEGAGFLLVVLPAPGLLRRLVPPQRVSLTLGLWGAYMPLGAALALLAGPPWIATFGWRSWWWVMAALAALAALALARGVNVAPPAGTAAPATAHWGARLARTLAAPGPWLVAAAFAVYSSQWLAVIGFLPAIYLNAGVAGWATGVLTALAAAVNIAGNVAGGRALHHGARPPLLLAAGYVAMALAAAVAFAGEAPAGAPAWLRYVAVLGFSMVGGMIPATLFALALRLAPDETTLSTTVGWVQQWSAFGQFAGPPLVAWVASRAGGWHWTWVATGACSLAGLALAAGIAHALRRGPMMSPSSR